MRWLRVATTTGCSPRAIAIASSRPRGLWLAAETKAGLRRCVTAGWSEVPRAVGHHAMRFDARGSGSSLNSNFNGQASSLVNNGHRGGLDDVRLYRDINYRGPSICLRNGDGFGDLSLGREHFSDGTIANDRISSHKWVRSCWPDRSRRRDPEPQRQRRHTLAEPAASPGPRARRLPPGESRRDRAGRGRSSWR